MTKKAPEKIYLQWYTEDCPENCRDEVTWCWDKIEETDVEYIRKDLYDLLLEKCKRIKKETDILLGIMESVNK